MLYYNMIIELSIETLKKLFSLKGKKRKDYAISNSSDQTDINRHQHITLARKSILCYDWGMNILTTSLGRGPSGDCGITTNCRLSLLESKDVSSSIVSCPTRTNIRITDVRRLFKIFAEKGGLYVCWY